MSVDAALPLALVRKANEDPGRLAVVDTDRELTCGLLLRGSAQVALDIVALTQGAPARVALLFDQDALYIQTLLGAMRAGAAYVPLDARRGVAWNQAVVAAADCAAIVCGEGSVELAQQFGRPIVIARGGAGDDDDICIARAPESLACIYFTSGTTGPPKGVCDSYRNLQHNALRYTTTLRTTGADRLSLIQHPIFSGTQSTIFMGLINGATLCSFDVARRGLDGLAGWLNHTGVTMFHATPSIFRTLARDGARYDNIRVVRIEGDRASHRDVAIWRTHFPHDSILVNGLGATECGLIRQYFVDRDTPVAPGELPVGGPVPDMDVSIVDAEGMPLAQGVVGEVCVTSRYLALGYLGDPDLTARKFRPAADGRRAYVTGDMGVLDDKGHLHLKGRRDHQAKVNGITVNLTDIEAALCELTAVRYAMVIQRQDDAQERAPLVAYLVPNGVARPAFAEIRSALAGRVPDHLLPTRFAWLDGFPMSPDGKVDRKALPAPSAARPDLETRYVAPRNSTERAIAGIFERLLGLEHIGVDDDLLMLGCDSITIVQAANRIEAELGVKVSVARFFEDPTIGALARDASR